MRKNVAAGLLAAGAVGVGAGAWLFRRPLGLVAGIMRAGRATPEALAALQRERLRALIAYARDNSAYYRALYHGLPNGIDDLRALPVVNKPDLMAHFDEWVTDPAATRAGVEAFAADPSRIGRRYLGRYTVWTTSGTTGKPGIFLHDRRATSIYWLLGTLRCYPREAPVIISRLLLGGRIAAVIATGGHFGVNDWIGRWRLDLPPAQRHRVQLISILTPLDKLVRELNDFQPHLLFGYPSNIKLLVGEQLAGRLRIAPEHIFPIGEGLDTVTRSQIEAAFHCAPRSFYGASEFAYAAFECDHGWLHVNADWVILEPVDANYQPTPPGQPSYTTLLTNLASRAQPLIRYDIGDSVTARPDPCDCGSPLPAIHVQGRTSDILRLRAPSGASVAIPPLAIGAVMEETPGAYRSQITQTAPDTLVVRLEVTPEADRADVWAAMERRLRAYLAEQGVPTITLTLAAEPPQQETLGGKFRQARNATLNAPAPR